MNKMYSVGGVRFPRPFRIRRLGHFMFMSGHMQQAVHFYTHLLGFKVSDSNDLTARASADQLRRMGDPKLYFIRYGSDHHSFVLGSDVVFEVLKFPMHPKITIGQMAWQVGSLREVIDADGWLRGEGVSLMRAGRDIPGSNWNTYFADPWGHPNELYYGMEQIGWSGRSKPSQMYPMYKEIATLPQKSEEQEVDEAFAGGIDLGSGNRPREPLPMNHEVGGIMLGRPFKVIGLGPVRMEVPDLDAALRFYRDQLGLTVTEETRWKGHRSVFLRAGSEHHSLVLHSDGIARELGLEPRFYCISLGLKVNDYQQLKDAARFLTAHGCQASYLPQELSPGMDHTVCFRDPDGHLIQLYYYMEQIGWDGKPRPAEQRRKVIPGEWPDAVDPLIDTFSDAPFNGPWG